MKIVSLIYKIVLIFSGQNFIILICPLPVLRTVYYSILNSKLQNEISYLFNYFETSRGITGKSIRAVIRPRGSEHLVTLHKHLNILPLIQVFTYLSCFKNFLCKSSIEKYSKNVFE